jgi:Holliday junction resolvase-like predicted endonuclease
MDHKHKKGFTSHLHAIQYLTKLGYWVFDNISKLGPCDLIGLNDKGDILLVDVKSTSKRKTGTHAGYFIKRAPSKQQKELGIRILMVSEDGSCVFEKPQKLAKK